MQHQHSYVKTGRKVPIAHKSKYFGYQVVCLCGDLPIIDAKNEAELDEILDSLNQESR